MFLSICLGAATWTAAGEPAGGHPQTAPIAQGGARHHHDATTHHRFDDVAHWVEVFDDPERDRWQRPAELVKALGLEPGDRVADIGAGTGYFERHLSEAVGTSGTVFAVDLEPSLIEHLRQRAEQENTANVVPVLGSPDNPRLPVGMLDLILIVNTYHHIDDRLAYFGALRQTLAKGGRLAVVDYFKRETPVGPPPSRKLSKDFVTQELRAAGFTLSEDLDLLPYQYVLVFRPARPAKD
jgi:ubiquinone/menaquinone biosynthesis C-methylase UbiE